MPSFWSVCSSFSVSLSDLHPVIIETANINTNNIATIFFISSHPIKIYRIYYINNKFFCQSRRRHIDEKATCKNKSLFGALDRNRTYDNPASEAGALSTELQAHYSYYTKQYI